MTTPTPSANPRRTFLKNLSAAGIGAITTALPSSASSSPSPAARVSASGKRRYVIVGAGSRHRMYRDAILNTYAEVAELVGICDLNPGRAELSAGIFKEKSGKSLPTYGPDGFEQMIQEKDAHIVIVTTMDSTHDEYVVRGLEAGCDVITEKPMTTTAAKCQRILDAQKRTGKKVRVTFNYRYSPPRTQVKDLLMKGEIGDILSVDFHWLLNTHHGADYFRRWHGHKENSGGLMVHKSTHHFDLVNWWLSGVPELVTAVGKRDFYTPKMATRLGLESYHERCHTCPEADTCGFFFSLAKSPSLKALYLDQEHHDGYFRDRCVFRPDISIEDTMNVIVKYDTGATLCYSLNAFNSWEGYQIAFNGTKGRIEHSITEQIYVNGTDAVQGGIQQGGVKTRVIPLRGAATDLEPWTGKGSHGGGDRVMLDAIFLPNPPADPWIRDSDHRGGAASILTGVAANRCFESGSPVRIADLIDGFEPPEYPPMPNHDGPLPMPAKRA